MDALIDCPICHCKARWVMGRTRRLVWIECTKNRNHRSKAYLVNYDGAKHAMENWNGYEKGEGDALGRGD